MADHIFILSPTSWIGEGKIQLNMFHEELNFLTRWDANNKDSGGSIECIQEIQIKGLSDIMNNQFSIFNLTPNGFEIELENMALGKIAGKGIITSKLIAWEFRVPHLGFEGFEFYEKQKDESYLMRAEYSTTDQYRTLITGKIWQHKKDKEKDKDKE
ncbi:MAG TPA: hypothetical protein VLG76_08260 [Rhabdochlamydiaceae bacterium]|nr:hypothetical protein [Rhabdochlamydiaceae bacterium]